MINHWCWIFGHFFLAPSHFLSFFPTTRRWFFVQRRGLMNQAPKFTSEPCFQSENKHHNQLQQWLFASPSSLRSPKLPRLRTTFLTDYWLKRNVIVSRRFQAPQIMAFNVTSTGRINSQSFYFQILYGDGSIIDVKQSARNLNKILMNRDKILFKRGFQIGTENFFATTGMQLSAESRFRI